MDVLTQQREDLLDLRYVDAVHQSPPNVWESLLGETLREDGANPVASRACLQPALELGGAPKRPNCFDGITHQKTRSIVGLCMALQIAFDGRGERVAVNERLSPNEAPRVHR